MKALRFVKQGVAQVDELDIPQIHSDEVLVAARSVGVCHSDIDLLEGRYIIPFSYPIIPGHEWSGEIVRVGDAVENFAVGDRVVGECVIGLDHFGFSISGAAADYFVAKADWLHRLPDEVSFTNGALVEPFSVAYYALMRAGSVNASDVVVVLGAGPIGLAVRRPSTFALMLPDCRPGRGHRCTPPLPFGRRPPQSNCPMSTVPPRASGR